MTERVDDCLEACLEVHRICLETASYLSTGSADEIRLLFNTAEVCRLSAGLLRSGADRNGQACAACAELCAALCEETARFCDDLESDPRLQLCADACRRCAAACRGLTALAA